MLWFYEIVYWLGWIAALGAVALGRYAWTARRLDEHPLCAQCRYDLYGTLDRTHSCPECGTRILGGRQLIIGHRTRHVPLLIAAVVLLIVALGSILGSQRGWWELRAEPFLLNNAIARNDLTTVELIIRKRPHLASGWFYGRSWPERLPPLHQAASIDQTAMVVVLLRHGADVQALDSHGMTALHHAAGRGGPAAVEHLLAAGASTTRRDNEGYQPLHAAVMRQDATAVGVTRRLLEGGADPDSATLDGHNVLRLAITYNGDAALLALLLEAGADPNQSDPQGMAALHHAAAGQRADLIPLLVAAGGMIHDVDDFGDAPLHLAVEQRHLPTVDALLVAGASVNLPDRHGRTALHKAHLLGGHEALVQRLTQAATAPGQPSPEPQEDLAPLQAAP